jgi:RHH-type proline utilization regulon transcriptional repressor/proline dehydrogenase/delta 1-pyrroline-5-carboxylate dehydrogenase
LSHDPSGLTFESNVFRYRPLPLMAIRIGRESEILCATRTLIAAKKSKSNIFVSVSPKLTHDLAEQGVTTQDEGGFLSWALANRPTGIRLIAEDRDELVARLGPSCFVDTRPMMLNGRIELPRYLREQSISETLHRFGNLVRRQGRTV